MFQGVTIEPSQAVQGIAQWKMKGGRDSKDSWSDDKRPKTAGGT